MGIPRDFKEFCDWCVLWATEVVGAAVKPSFLLSTDDGVMLDDFPIGSTPTSHFVALTTLAGVLKEHRPTYFAVVLPANVAAEGATFRKRARERTSQGVVLAAFSEGEKRTLSCADPQAAAWVEVSDVKGALYESLERLAEEWRVERSIAERLSLITLKAPQVRKVVDDVVSSTMPEGRTIVPSGRLIAVATEAIERLDRVVRQEILDAGVEYLAQLPAVASGSQTEAMRRILATLIVVQLATQGLEELGVVSIVLDDPEVGHLAFLGPEDRSAVTDEELEIAYAEAIAEETGNV